MDRICRRCGCSSFHFNSSNLRFECARCGTPPYDPQEEQRIMQYERSFALAMRHLAAGNWQQTISLLRPLMADYPTDRKLYHAVLRAATHDFSDMDMENAADKAAASDAWEKLERTRGVDSEMLRYSRKRYEKSREELRNKMTIILLWFFGGVLAAVMTAFFSMNGKLDLVALCSVGIMFCLYKIVLSSPFDVLHELRKAPPNFRRNPFRQ